MSGAADPKGGDGALVGLLQALRARDYHFVTPTPLTHGRYLEREGARPARDLRDIFGWNLGFDPAMLPSPLLESLVEADALERCGERFRSRYRVATIGQDLFLHSPFPTEAEDSVFLGPDTYRFARFLRASLPERGGRLVDLGAGSGAGAITAARCRSGIAPLLIDPNEKALRLARINAAAAGIAIETIEGAAPEALPDTLDLVIANPPFMRDPARRTYRHGGDLHGGALSLAWALAAAERLAAEGRMLLYTGSAIVDGRDRLREALEAGLASRGCAMRYEEIDPDIFGEQLLEPGYETVERIAAVGAVITRA